KRAAAPAWTIAGKTGTCTGQGSKLGLFTSYGPVHDPQIAVSVILRNSGTGGKWAAAVAGDVYRRLAYDARFAPKPGSQPMLANDMIAPRPHIDPRKAAEVSDEEREDEATEAGNAAEDAFVVSEAGQDASGAGAQRPALQKTSKPVERPAAAPTTTAPRPNNNNYTTAPATNGAERPRRVSDRP
ncbi:MAG TPA: penicillin-binding transpeptidase domain-containing protein, partial [Pyrinomonadaceae bacterium]